MQNIQKAVAATISWALNPKPDDDESRTTTIEHAPNLKSYITAGVRNGVGIISQKVTLRRVGNRIVRAHWIQDSESAILSYLFSLLAPEIQTSKGQRKKKEEPKWIGQCHTCRKIFALNGRGRPRLFCADSCQWESRDRGDYFKRYQRKKRGDMNKLKERDPELFEKVSRAPTPEQRSSYERD